MSDQNQTNKHQNQNQNQNQDQDQQPSIPVPPKCERLHQSLSACLGQSGRDTWRADAQCRHLNRALAECIISTICPHETEAVRSLCGSGGTLVKRAQCERARVGLAVCMAAHQE